MIHMGVDLGVRRVAVACAYAGGVSGWTAELNLKPGKDRHWELRELASFLWRAPGDHGVAHNDVAVWMERTFVSDGAKGNRTVSLAMAETAGALLTAAHWPQATMVVPGSWKAGLLGDGRASKEDIEEWLWRRYPELAVLCSTQDQMDCMCMSLYGQGRESGEILAPVPPPKRKRKPRKPAGDPYAGKNAL